MNNKKLGITLVVVVALLLVASTLVFTLESYQIAIVKTFGKASAPLDGTAHAGLHWKLPWPIQSVTHYDARTFIFDDTHEQVPTKDGQNIVLTVYCCWRIKDPLEFVRNAPHSSVKEAESSLRDIVRSAKKTVLGQHIMGDLVNTDPTKMIIHDIEGEIRKNVQDNSAIYGVEIMDMGIKSIGLAPEVSKAVIENMKSERNRLAEGYKSGGKSVADAIRNQANNISMQIIQFADNRAKQIRAEGDAAASHYNNIFQKDPQFANFLRELDYLKESLKDNTVMIIDPSLLHAYTYLQPGPITMPPTSQPSTVTLPPTGGK